MKNSLLSCLSNCNIYDWVYFRLCIIHRHKWKKPVFVDSRYSTLIIDEAESCNYNHGNMAMKIFLKRSKPLGIINIHQGNQSKLKLAVLSPIVSQPFEKQYRYKPTNFNKGVKERWLIYLWMHNTDQNLFTSKFALTCFKMMRRVSRD